MDYQILFDASQKPFNWQFSAFALLLVGGLALAIILTLSASKGTVVERIRKRVVLSGALGLIFCLSWAIIAYNISYMQYRVCQDALESGSFTTIEGRIENFQPSSNSKGLPPEQFTVDGVTFRYKDSMVSCGYTRTTSGDGPIKNNAHVRIAYLPHMNNTILRLEVRLSE